MATEKKYLKSIILDDETNKYIEDNAKVFAKLTQRNRVSETAFIRHVILGFKGMFGNDIKKSME